MWKGFEDQLLTKVILNAVILYPKKICKYGLDRLKLKRDDVNKVVITSLDKIN